MENDSKKTTNKQSNYAQELSARRGQWYKDLSDLEQQFKALEYPDLLPKDLLNAVTLAQLIQEAPNHSVQSQLLDIKGRYEELIEQNKVLYPEEWVVEALNKDHAVIHIDQTAILTEKISPRGDKDFSIESRTSFRHLYENQIVICSDGKARNKADIWLRHPNRRQFMGITFDPTTTEHINGCYNIWKGFALTAKQGSTVLFWTHVEQVICSGNATHYIYVRKLLAYIVQRPDVVHIALVLCGSQGVGKNTFVDALGILFGQHYVSLSSLHGLTSNFNYHLKSAVIVHANEALWGGHKKDIGTIKSMITDPFIFIEGKGKDGYMVKNHMHFILSSNERWPVHVDKDDRRFFVLQVSELHKEDRVYFAAIQTELKNGGYEALLYDLQNEPLEGFDPREIPYSTAAFSLKMESTDSATRYIYNALNEQLLEWSTQVGSHQINSSIAVEVLYNHYHGWCTTSGETYIEKKGGFCRTFKELLPSTKNYRPTVGAERQQHYILPTLEQGKKDFCAAFKAKMSDIFPELCDLSSEQ